MNLRLPGGMDSGTATLGLVLGFILGLIALALAAWVIAELSQWLRRRGPLTTLEERYARGELTREEFLRHRADLLAVRNGGPIPPAGPPSGPPTPATAAGVAPRRPGRGPTPPPAAPPTA